MGKYRIDVNSESFVFDTGLESYVVSQLIKRAIGECVPTPAIGNGVLRTILFTRLDIDAPSTEDVINQGATFDTMNVKIPATTSDKKLVAIVRGALTGKV